MNASGAVLYPAYQALVDAYHRRLNTRLVFRRDGVERSVVLLFRKVLFVNSTEKKDRLELLLATRKLLTKDEILRLAAKSREQGIDFMTVVQREGVLKDVAMVDLMTERAVDILLSLASWSEVEVDQDPLFFMAEPVLPLNLNLMPVLFDGLMARLGVDDCRSILESEDYIPRRADEQERLVAELQESAHAAEAASVFALVDGRRTIADIMQELDAEALAPMKILTALRLVGVLERPTKSTGSPGLIAESPPAPSKVKTAKAPEPKAREEIAEPVALTAEERSTLSGIFEGASNVLEDESTSSAPIGIEILDDDEQTVGPTAHAASPREDEPMLLQPEPETPEADHGYADGYAGDGDEEAWVPESTEVRNEFNALLDIDPDEAARLFLKGVEFFQEGEVAQAIETYRQAIDKDPSNAEYYSALGIAYLEDAPDSSSDDELAMRNFLEAVKLDPVVEKNHYYIGRILERRGEREEAITFYEEALRQTPDYPPAKHALDILRGGMDTAGDRGGFLRRIFGR